MMTPRAMQTSGRCRRHSSCTPLGNSFDPGTRTSTIRRSLTPAASRWSRTWLSNASTTRGLNRAAATPTVKAAPPVPDALGACWLIMKAPSGNLIAGGCKTKNRSRSDFPGRSRRWLQPRRSDCWRAARSLDPTGVLRLSAAGARRSAAAGNNLLHWHLLHNLQPKALQGGNVHGSI